MDYPPLFGSPFNDLVFFVVLWLAALYGFYTLLTNEKVWDHGDTVVLAIAYPSVLGTFFIPVCIGAVLGGYFFWLGLGSVALFICLLVNVS